MVTLYNAHCLFTLKIVNPPQNYVNKQWVLHNIHRESFLSLKGYGEHAGVRTIFLPAIVLCKRNLVHFFRVERLVKV